MSQPVDRVAQTRGWVADVVRSGLLSPDAAYAEVRAVVAEDHPELNAERTARGWLADAERQWRTEATAYPETTDHDRLELAFADLEGQGVRVLQGCPDHWAAKAVCDAGGSWAGVAWFTPSDVWHAIDAGMLEVNLWHITSANAAPGDALLDAAIAVFERHGLPAHFDEGRIEVSAFWQRRPTNKG